MPRMQADEHGVNIPMATEDEKATVAETIHDKFQAVFDDAKDDGLMDKVEPVTVETKEEKEPVAEEKPTEEKPTEEAKTDDDDVDEDEPAKEAAVSKTPILPAAYRRSLKAYEWTDEEIEEALEAGGESFVAKVASKIHDTRNKETQQWANLGRQQRSASSTTVAPQQVLGRPFLEPIDVGNLKKEYGDEKLIGTFEQVNKAIEVLNRIMPAVQQSQAQAEMSKQEALGQQIDTFFSSQELKPFSDKFGTATKTLTKEQIVERQRVLELADAIAGGARLQARNLSLEDALQHAVDAVTSETKEKAARDKIVGQLKTRNRGITMKPGARTTVPSKRSGPPTRDELGKRVKSKLQAIFAGA